MESDEKKIEVFIDKVMSNEALDIPSFDFTSKVMDAVTVTSKSEATVYKPLISKWVWFTILGSFIALIGYIYLKKPVTDSTLLERFNLPNVSLNPFQNLAFDFSTTLMYAVVLLALMVSIQVPLLKHYFNKRMTF